MELNAERAMWSYAEVSAAATIVKLKAGSSRVLVRRKGQYPSKTFLRKSDANPLCWDFKRSPDQSRHSARRSACRAAGSQE
jgi:hypothetical protein